MWEGSDSKCLSLGDSEDWAVRCTFMDSEGTERTVCVMNNGFSLKLSRTDAQKAIERIDLELRSEV